MSWPLDVQALRRNSRTVTGIYSATGSDFTIRADCNDADTTIMLPRADENTGQLVFVKKVDSSGNSAIVYAAETIDGGSTVFIADHNGTKLFQSNGESWDVLF